MYRRILVPTDGGKLSSKAVAHALGLAKALGASVTALYATPSLPRPIYGDSVLEDPGAGAQYAQAAARDAERILAPIERQAQSADVPCEVVHAINDTPWEAILEAAHARKCDVIVMASHGRRGMAAVLLGSETHKVLTHTKIPVVVVR